MSKVIISSHQEFEQYLGKEFGVSDYLKITQERINKFADATIDYQWIHTNPKRAAKEGSFGCTISHGYLNISIAPFLWEQILQNTQYQYDDQLWCRGFEVQPSSSGEYRGTSSSQTSFTGKSEGYFLCQLHVTLEIKDNSNPGLYRNSCVSVLF
ncbi:MAG: MaoC/PaaZ C-terminal domain-containing protein [Cyclobacteriaceae bacterium]|nr:MaoC/PaaZ C-terminal domain-containing protein [Cyclobacteriaceae bacterium]